MTSLEEDEAVEGTGATALEMPFDSSLISFFYFFSFLNMLLMAERSSESGSHITALSCV